MHVERIRLKNFGPHIDVDVELPKGLVAIVGRNGVGKTTLIEAVYFCLANNFLGDGVRDEWIRTGAGEKEESYAWCDFADERGSFSIKRSLRPNKVVLADGEGKEIKGAAGVAAWLVDRGVDAATLPTYVFPAQEDFASCLSSSPTERAKSFQKLCDTMIAEKYYAVLGPYIERMRAAADALAAFSPGDLDELKTKLATSRAGEATAIAAVQALDGKILTAAQREKFERVVAGRRTGHANWVTWKKLRPERDEAKRERAAAEDVLAELETDELDLHEKLQGLQFDQAKLADEMHIHALETEMWANYDKAVVAHEEATRRVAACDRQPVEPADYQPPEVRDVKFRQLIERANDADRQLEEARSGFCSSCRQKLPGAEDVDLAPLETLAKSARARLAKYETVSDVWRDYDEALSIWQTEYNDLVNRLKARPMPTEPSRPRPAPKEWPDAAFKKQAANLQSAYDAATLKTQQQRSRVRGLEQRIDKLQGRIDELASSVRASPTQEAATKAFSALKLDRKRAEALAKRTERLAGHREAIKLLEEQLAKCATSADRQKALEAEIQLFVELRRLFHRDGLPQDVAAHNLGRVRAALNAQIAALGLDFEVETNDDLSFSAKGQAARRLSGGQKMLLATAFYRTWLEIGATGVSMLFLDEPTAWVDAVNLHTMRDYFERLAAAIRGQTQIVVVTHHAELTSAFDKVLTL